MGFLKDIIGIAAPIAGGIFGGPVGSAIGGALGGAISGSGAPRSQTTTTQQQLDPRVQNILFGGDGNSGVLNQWASLANQQPNAGSQAIGNTASGYLQNAAPGAISSITNAADRLISGRPTPQVGATGTSVEWNRGTTVGAPSQNNMNLSGAYDRVINGDAGANPYLTSALQSGVDMTNAAYQRNQTDLTNNLQRNVLPSIRSGAIASGQYGGSRQGIAEGNALSDYTNQLTNANLQLGLANSANTTGQQANAFNQGQDRSLSALQGLSSQQYGTASQNANLGQQANLANQQASNQARDFNARATQDANLANAQLQLQTGAQNNAGAVAGSGLLSGLMGQLYGYNQNADNASLNRAQQVSGILAPFIGANSSSSSTQPLYSNTGASALGGAASALGLYNQIQGGFGTGGSNGYGTGNNFSFSPSPLSTNPGALQNLGFFA